MVVNYKLSGAGNGNIEMMSRILMIILISICGRIEIIGAISLRTKMTPICCNGGIMLILKMLFNV